MIKLTIMLQKMQIDQAVGVVFEDEPARVAPLRNVVWNIDCDHARQSSHM